MADVEFESKVRDTNQVILNAIDRAEDLLKESEQRRLTREEAWANLPLFEAGTTHGTQEAYWGFRVRDGYHVDVCTNGAVKIGSVRTQGADDGKIHTFVNRWPEGIAWCYWSDARRAPCGKSLAECVMAYGVGGWRDTVRDLQAKVVYTDASRSYKPGHCFIIMSRSPRLKSRSIKGRGGLRCISRLSARCHRMHKSSACELANLTERPILLAGGSGQPTADKQHDDKTQYRNFVVA